MSTFQRDRTIPARRVSAYKYWPCVSHVVAAQLSNLLSCGKQVAAILSFVKFWGCVVSVCAL